MSRHERLKSIYNTSSRGIIKAKPKLKLSSTLIRPQPDLKTNDSCSPKALKLQSIPDSIGKSIKNLSGLLSTKTSKRINLSMYSPSNNSIKTSRSHIRGIESLSLSNKRIIKYPLTPQQALKGLKDWLSEYESAEINSYKLIYYIGIGAKKTVPDPNFPNMNYDNEHGDYKVVIGDHISFRYEVVSMLGKGSFGQVCKCFDHKSKELAAVKIIKNKKKFHKQGAVEIELLKNMAEKDPDDYYNIVRIKDSFVFRHHLCIVFELLSISLYDLLKKNCFQGLPLNIVSRFALQILLALQYYSSLSIIHCDLKPENILLKNINKCGVKVIDFGSGCYEDQQIYTYIQSRFYRAPEIMLGLRYTHAIDMWSFACILVELYTGYPLFPGESEQDQFSRIMEVLDVPPEDLLKVCSRKNVFFDSQGKPRIFQNSKGKVRHPGARKLEEFVGKEDMDFLSFLHEILQWEPELRPTPSEALSHPWITNIIYPKVVQNRKKRVIKSFLNISEINNT